MSALPQFAPLEISEAVTSHSIALGFVKNLDGNFEFVSPITSEIEKFFGLNLVDELTFFAPTGKAGELFEVPVSAEDSPTDRLFLVAIGDQSGSSARAAGAAVFGMCCLRGQIICNIGFARRLGLEFKD
jgi:leucyl aminopeptidase